MGEAAVICVFMALKTNELVSLGERSARSGNAEAGVTSGGE